jgi:hypothetical protein
MGGGVGDGAALKTRPVDQRGCQREEKEERKRSNLLAACPGGPGTYLVGRPHLIGRERVVGLWRPRSVLRRASGAPRSTEKSLWPVVPYGVGAGGTLCSHREYRNSDDAHCRHGKYGAQVEGLQVTSRPAPRRPGTSLLCSATKGSQRSTVASA